MHSPVPSKKGLQSSPSSPLELVETEEEFVDVEIDLFVDQYLSQLLLINDSTYFSRVLSSLSPEDLDMLLRMDSNKKQSMAITAVTTLYPTASVFDVVSNVDPAEEVNVRALLNACRIERFAVSFATEHLSFREYTNDQERTILNYEGFAELLGYAIKLRHPLIPLFVDVPNHSNKSCPLYTIFAPSSDLQTLITEAVVERAIREIMESYSFDEELNEFVSSYKESLIEIVTGTFECDANGGGRKLYVLHSNAAQSTDASYEQFSTSHSGIVPASTIESATSTSPLVLTSSTLSAYMQYNGITYLVTSGHGHGKSAPPPSIIQSIRNLLTGRFPDKKLFSSMQITPTAEERRGIRLDSSGGDEEVTMFAFPEGWVEHIASIWPMDHSFRPSPTEILELRYTDASPKEMMYRQRQAYILPVFCLADISIFRLDDRLSELWTTKPLPPGVEVIDLNTHPMVMAEGDGRYYALPSDVHQKIKTVFGERGNTREGEVEIRGYGHFSRIFERQMVNEVLYYGKTMNPFVSGDSGTPLIQSKVRTLHSFFKGRISNFYMSTPVEIAAKQVLQVLRSRENA